jgi:phosphomannomutase
VTEKTIQGKATEGLSFCTAEGIRYAEIDFFADEVIKMTKVTIELSSNSKLDLLLAFLRRLGNAEEVKVAVESNGAASDPALENDLRFEAMINQVIEDALAGKIEPMTDAEAEAEWRELAAYGAQKAAALGITSDKDVDRLVAAYRL